MQATNGFLSLNTTLLLVPVKSTENIHRIELNHAELWAVAPPATSSSAAAGGGAASTGLEQGTKRKRDDQSDDDDENGAHEEGVDDAAPLC